MPVPTDHLVDDIRELTAKVTDVKVGFGRFEAATGAQLQLIKWVGVFFAGLLVPLLGFAFNVSWNASTLVSEVRQQGTALEQVSQKLDRLENVAPEVRQLGNKLERVEQRLDRLEKIEQQVGQILQRLDQIAAPKPKS